MENKEILGGRYTIYSDGSCVSNLTGSVVGHKNMDGYLRIQDYQTKKFYLIHRLVAEAFLPEYSEHLEVHHIDGNRENNCIYNLMLLTKEEHSKITNEENGNTAYRGISRQDIEKSLSTTLNWSLTANLLGFKTASSLIRYYDSVSCKNSEALAKSLGVKTFTKNIQQTTYLRSLSLEDFINLKGEKSWDALAKSLGVSRSTIFNILNEKRAKEQHE